MSRLSYLTWASLLVDPLLEQPSWKVVNRGTEQLSRSRAMVEAPLQAYNDSSYTGQARANTNSNATTHSFLTHAPGPSTTS